MTNNWNRKRMVNIRFDVSEEFYGGGRNENNGSKSEGKGLGVEKHLWTNEGGTDSENSEG
ncbi:MAG: hypothetical protein ACXU9P_09925 [Thermodesulfobacteriota bacterium]